ncbi:M48 family metalloprotease [Ideonella sp. A 288]|uniref:M48 family metalloprotease n=1 Tax=Ideonella sp. A 288 TaxID=1962181 RepID=UPI000B4B37EE|nr:M48 family metalloprotease [Ideonella sp. A 288]
MPRHRLALLLVVAALLGACSTVKNPVTGQDERTVMDERSEIAEGAKGHAEVLKEYPLLSNPPLQAYVDDIGQRLARQSHRAGLKWTFTVLDSPEVNAFALPGGYVYVTRGILAYLDSEADLAGVLGHEIGHVTARHGAQRATRAQAAGIGVFAATVLGAVLESGGVSGAGNMAGQLSQAAAAGFIASYSRDQELQADQLGAEYLARTRYDPSNMVDVIRTLRDQDLFRADVAKAEGRPAPQQANWLSSHPSGEQRLAEIARRAAAYKGSYDDDGRARYLKAIEAIPFGESREQGVTRGRHFFHEPLGVALTAPAQWSIQNDTEAITLVNAAGDAALVVRLVPSQAGATHDEIVRNLIKPEQVRSERRTLGGGLSATHLTGSRRNAQGQAQGFELTLATGPGNRHYLMSYAAKDAAALERSRAGLREAEASFRLIGEAERAAARSWEIRLVPLPAGGFDELARRSPLGPHARAQLLLLNGSYSGQAVTPGRLVKVVQVR